MAFLQTRLFKMLLLLIIAFLVFLILLMLLSKPIISFAYEAEPLIHTIQKLKPKKIRIIQYGDIISGEKYLPNSKIELTFKNGQKIASVKVAKDGSWEYTIPKDLKEGRYLVSADTIINGNKYHIKDFNLRVVFNRPFYKKHKKFLVSVNKTRDSFLNILNFGKK